MPCRVIVRLTGPRAGDIVTVEADGAPIGAQEGLPNWGRIRVADRMMHQLRDRAESWWMRPTFSVVASDAAQDGYRIAVQNELPGVTAGAITREDVEQFIQQWGGSIVSVAANEVRFDVRIYDAAISPRFLGYQPGLPGLVFSEVSYDQATGVHVIECDYSGAPVNGTAVEVRLLDAGATVLSHAAGLVQYSVARGTVRERFQADIANLAQRVVAKSRYYVGPGVVSTLAAAPGGIVDADMATLLTYLRDRVAE